MTPNLSNHGKRLKRSHHTKIARLPKTPAMTAYGMAPGTNQGRANRPTSTRTARATPGQRRSAGRGLLSGGGNKAMMKADAGVAGFVPDLFRYPAR